MQWLILKLFFHIIDNAVYKTETVFFLIPNNFFIWWYYKSLKFFFGLLCIVIILYYEVLNTRSLKTFL